MQAPLDWKNSNKDPNIEPINRSNPVQVVETRCLPTVEKTAQIEANVATIATE